MQDASGKQRIEGGRQFLALLSPAKHASNQASHQRKGRGEGCAVAAIDLGDVLLK